MLWPSQSPDINPTDTHRRFWTNETLYAGFCCNLSLICALLMLYSASHTHSCTHTLITYTTNNCHFLPVLQSQTSSARTQYYAFPHATTVLMLALYLFLCVSSKYSDTKYWLPYVNSTGSLVTNALNIQCSCPSTNTQFCLFSQCTQRGSHSHTFMHTCIQCEIWVESLLGCYICILHSKLIYKLKLL